MKVVPFVFVILFATFVYVVIFGRMAFQPKTLSLDFVAFYCSGEAVRAGADPYLTEPLRSCEHRVGASFRSGSALVLPSPLPAYDIAVFEAISFIPFSVAQWLWGFLGLSACFGCALLCRKPSGPSLLVAIAGLGLSLAYVSIPLGQILPFSLLGLLLCVHACVYRKTWLLCVGIVLASAEPHLALPAVLSLLLMRSSWIAVTTVVSLLSLALLSLFCQPFPVLLEYLHDVLPSHALSEINNQEQFGLVHEMHLSGLSDSVAVHVAGVLFALTLILGLVLGRLSFPRLGFVGVVFVPVVTSLLASPFLHVTQIAVAVPLALSLSFFGKVVVRRLAIIASALLCVPWLDFAPMVVVAPLAVVFCSMLLLLLGRRSAIIGGLLAFVGTILCACAAIALGEEPRRFLNISAGGPGTLAEVGWREAIDLSDVGHEWFFLLAKMPAQVGIFLILAAVILAIRTPVVVSEPDVLSANRLVR